MPISKSTRLCYSFAPTACTLPPEIVDLIVQDEGLEKSDLRNLSLVAYVWKEPSQRRLFSSISLDPGKSHDLYDIDPDSQDTRLIRYIKHLTLASPTKGAWTPFSGRNEDPEARQEDPVPELNKDEKEDFHSEFSGIELGSTLIHMVPDPEASGSPHAKFPTFLHQISRLESLTVRDRLNWYLLPREAFTAFLYIFSLGTFQSLQICRESGTRFPFIFLHFCFNLKRLSLNVWPTTLLTPVGIEESDTLSLSDKPTVYPTVLKLTGANVIDSVKYYVEHDNLELGNSISFERLRALYIAYDEDPACSTRGSVWHSKRVGSFLSSFGQPLEELVLELDHRNYSSRAPSTIPSTALARLTNLRNLKIIIHNGTLPELDFVEATEWLLPLLKSLPCPEQLETFDLRYSSTFRWTDDFGDLSRRGEDFLEELYTLLSCKFTRLKDARVRLSLVSMNGPSDDTPPPCDVVKRCDYRGMVKLKEKGVRVMLRADVVAGYDEYLV